MDGSIRFSKKERKIVLHAYRHAACARTVRRALVLVLLDRGWSYREIAEATLVSHETIAGVKRAYLDSGVEAALGHQTKQAVVPFWLIVVLRWLLSHTPQDFRFFRQRWSCEMLSILLREEHGICLSAETVRRGLNIHLNPKIGSQWMVCAEQAQVVTPGDNEKRHLAGSLVYRTGTLLVSSPATRRNAQMFIAHLDDLRRRLRSSRVIHVICDNAKFHDCRAVREYLTRWAHRMKLHFLPTRAPETNPIERVWWRLHEAITRNHRATTMEGLLDQVYDWIDHQGSLSTTIQATYAQAA
jgi:putative transposase